MFKLLIIVVIALAASIGTWFFIKNNKSKFDAANEAVDKIKKKKK
jgi:uncharacterized protein (UPF0333 family)